ncbi:hypothetical protein LJK88_16935 [Paenibacillus sp. P26]|nr:hypothetical protein LJK88_16935 [Paenibacillus sp. P26]
MTGDLLRSIILYNLLPKSKNTPPGPKQLERRWTMLYSSKDDSETKVLKAVIGEIEAVRIKRQQQYRELQSHPELKRFTQQELNDVAFTSYKNLLSGRSRRIPTRTAILDIADYLECTTAERNDLLLAAGYIPEHYELTGSALKLALEQAKLILCGLPLPAFIATHKFDITDMNPMFQGLYEVTYDMLHNGRYNMMHNHFNPDYPIRERSSFNAESFRKWESHAIYGIQTFKQHNMYFRYDAWYRTLLQEFNRLKDFKTYWDYESASPADPISESKMLIVRKGEDSEWFPIRLRQIHISVSVPYVSPN